jgi:PKD repeat protein
LPFCTAPPLQVTWASAGPGLIQFFTNWPAATSYQWNFGGGSSSTAASPVQFFSTGFHQVCLIASDGCRTDTVCLTIPVCGRPALAISTTPAGTNLTQFSSNWPNAQSYSWDFGNGSMSSSASPTQFFFPGNYTVCLTVVDSLCGTQTECIQFNPCPRPPLSFTYVQVSPLTIRYTPSTTQANSYAWDLGDGRGSGVISPTVTYGQVGSYRVCLTIEDDCGIETYCDTVLVTDVSLNDYSTLPFTMYPNPTKDLVILEWSGARDIVYQITNQMGQVVAQESLRTSSSARISVKSLPVGVYFLQVSDGMFSGLQKLVIER